MNLGPLMVGIRGVVLTEEEREWLNHPLVGGVILFQRNIESPQQVAELTRALHCLRKPALLLAVDQEGGRVQRLQRGFTHLPPLGALGRLYERDPKQALGLAESHGWLMAAEVRAVGFDLSFAPVADLDRGSEVIGNRAFHREPEVVSTLARRYLKGVHRAGMAAMAKHFPGHGSVRADSHDELPRDERPLSDLMGADLLPFADLIRHDLPGIMASHVVYPQVDEASAGFSRTWLQAILRRRLRFNGAIFSDDLCMTATHSVGDCTARARLALEAGCDMAIVAEPGEVPELLQRLNPRDDPTVQTRLLGLRGTGHTPLERLRKSLPWRNAVKQIESLAAQT